MYNYVHQHVTDQIKRMQERECNFNFFFLTILSQFLKYCHKNIVTIYMHFPDFGSKICQRSSVNGISKKFILIWVSGYFFKVCWNPILGTILNSLIFQYPPPADAWCQYIRSRMSSISVQFSKWDNFENISIFGQKLGMSDCADWIWLAW